jgi:beta-lactamase regulating signal transducer with metallopeptidase domain
VTAALPLPDAAGQLALLLRATLLMGAAWAAAVALRRAGASAAARHLAWLLGIAALLALPLLWYWVPALGLPILPAEAATAAAESPPALASPALVLTGPVSADVPIQAGLGMVLLAVYALGTATLLLRLIVGRRMLRRLWSDAGSVLDPAWQTLLSRLSSEMLVSRRVELRIARGPAVPMTWGTLAPKLLLPAEASEWPPERRRLVLLHELAHVARRDSLSRSLASLACAFYWFHPGAWFAARQMRMEQEHAADDRVLMAGGSPKAYALSLLHLARGAGTRPRFDQAAAMAGMYQLERRLVSITGAARRNHPGTIFFSSSALLAGLTTLFVAAGVPVSASTPLLRSSPANPTGTAAVLEKSVASGRAEESSPRPGRAAGSEKAVERFARERAAASESRPDGPAWEARAIAERAPPRRDGIVPGESEPTDPGRDGSEDLSRSSAHAQPLRDYGWELPRGHSRVEIGSSTASSQPSRLTLPTPLYPASRERTGRPRWARNVPRLVRGDKPTGSPLFTSQGPLTLSWSIGVGAK